MMLLAALLSAVGTADLVPRARHGAGLLAMAVVLLGLGAGWHTLWLLLVGAVVLVVWLDAARHRSTAGTVLLTLAAVLSVAFGQDVPRHDAPFGSWYDSLEVPGLALVPLQEAALGLGVLLFLASSANVVVRQALTATGPQVLEQEQSLQGGRLLGPLERWFVFGFAVSGHLGAIAAVVAAKGILRFPEISRENPSGLRAEYVLVGSFVSWGLALLFVPLF